MNDLKIYKEIAHAKNLMDDEYKSLFDYGIRGAIKTAPQVVFTIYYDFKPYQQDDPLLLTGCVTPLLEPPKDMVMISFLIVLSSSCASVSSTF